MPVLVTEAFAVVSVGLATLYGALAKRAMLDAKRSFHREGFAPSRGALLSGTTTMFVALAGLVLRVGGATGFDASSMSAVLSAFVIGDCFGSAIFLVANLQAAAAVLATQTLRVTEGV